MLVTITHATAVTITGTKTGAAMIAGGTGPVWPPGDDVGSGRSNEDIVTITGTKTDAAMIAGGTGPVWPPGDDVGSGWSDEDIEVEDSDTDCGGGATVESRTEVEVTVVAEVDPEEDGASVPLAGIREESMAVESALVGVTLSVVEAVEENSESGVEVG